MFEINDSLESASQGWLEASKEENLIRINIRNEFDKFLRIWLGWMGLTHKDKLIIGDYAIIRDDFSHSISVWDSFSIYRRNRKKLFERKRTPTIILTVGYDINVDWLPGNEHRYSVIHLQGYNPEYNDIYTELFNLLQSDYEEKLKEKTYELNTKNAFTQLSFEEKNDT
jgi:hypothetical protein